VGNNGTILNTTNGGNTWIPKTYLTPTTNGPINDYLKDVTFFDSNIGMIVSGTPFSDSINYSLEYGLIYRTTNGGATWDNVYVHSSAAFNGVSFLNASTAIAVGVVRPSSACYSITTNGGTSWELLYWSGITDPLTDVSFYDDNFGTAVGFNGRILHTNDGTSTWYSQSSGTMNNLHGVCLTSTNSGTIVGDAGTILHTSNGGTSWVSQPSGTTEDLLGISFIDAEKGTIVGKNGITLETTDGGITWELQSVRTNEDLFSVSFVSGGSGNIVGDNGIILRTTEDVTVPEYDFYFTSLAGMNQARYGHGYATNGEYIYSICGGISEAPWKSTSLERYDVASNTWTEIISGLIPRRFCTAEYVPSQDKIYVFNGDTYTSSTYTDTVEIINILSNELSYSATNPYPVEYSGSAVWNNKIYLFGGSNSDGFSNRLYEFNPQTNTWTRLPDMPEAKQTNGEIINGVLYIFGGYAGSTSNRIDSYNIQDLTWTYLGEMPDGISTHATAKSAEDIWLVGSYDNLKYFAQYDTELNLFTQLNSDMTDRRHTGAVVIENNLYIFGGNQVSSNFSSLNSLEYAEIFTPVSVADENITEGPHTHILSQNYPNPFNPSTTIEYELSKQTKVKLIVFNIRGQAVNTLHDEVKSPGNYEVQWNGLDQSGNQVSTGVYFCRLQAGQFSQTIKMVYLR